MGTRVRKNWSKEDERVLLDQVKRHADNLAEAFRQAARLLGRKPSGCEGHWYYLQKKKSTEICLLTIGHTLTSNRKVRRKNSPKGVTQKKSSAWWRKLLKFIFP